MSENEEDKSTDSVRGRKHCSVVSYLFLQDQNWTGVYQGEERITRGERVMCDLLPSFAQNCIKIWIIFVFFKTFFPLSSVLV